MNDSPDRVNDAIRAALATFMLSGAYILFASVSSIHEYKGLPFTAWDPGLGVLFAAMILRPTIAVPALFLGVAGAEAFVLRSALGWLHIVSVAIVVTAVYALVAATTRRIWNFDAALPRLQDVLILLAAGVVSAALSAALLLTLLISSGNLLLSDIAAAGWPRLVGDTIGLSIVAPLCLRYMGRMLIFRPRISIQHIWETLSLVFSIALFAWLVAGSASRENLQYFYLLFIPVVLAAVRHGLDGASVMLALTQAALVGILDWLQADARNFTNYQTLMLVLTATGLLVGAIVSERDLAQQRARAMEWEAARAGRFNLVSGMAAALSHEISQPLTAARARARTVELLLENGDMARIRDNLKPLVEQIDRAANILQHMREFLRRGTPARSSNDWSTIAAAARSLLEPLAEAKRITLSITPLNGLPAIECNRVQIEQVIINLAGNAIEAIAETGQPDGRVSIEARVVEDLQMLEIAVRDNGPGMDPVMVEHLFNATSTTRPDGLGLGIAISVAIVESHRGRLWLERSRKGNTEFRFRIPLAQSGE